MQETRNMREILHKIHVVRRRDSFISLNSAHHVSCCNGVGSKEKQSSDGFSRQSLLNYFLIF